MMLIKTQINDILACPHCHETLKSFESSFECPKCNKTFPIQEGIPNFSNHNVEKTNDSEFQEDRMFERTITAKIHNIGQKFINSNYTPHDHVTKFIRNIEIGKIIVELGSGNRHLRDDVINVDLFPFPNVDIITDISKTPFCDASIDYIVLDTVLEHVPEPYTVIKEIYRILKPEGHVICIAPWIFPYHGYPKNYFNISKDGLEFLFRDFSECKIEMDMGPTSALTNIVSEYFAIALSGKHKIVYSLVKGFILLPIFLFKYLDIFWYPSAKALRIAATLCALVKK